VIAEQHAAQLRLSQIQPLQHSPGRHSSQSISSKYYLLVWSLDLREDVEQSDHSLSGMVLMQLAKRSNLGIGLCQEHIFLKLVGVVCINVVEVTLCMQCMLGRA